MEEIKFIDHIKSLDFGEVAIWGVDISEMDYEYDQYSRLLLKEELVKINRLKNKQSRLTSVVARSGLRILSGVYLNKDPKKIIFKKLHNGKPIIDSHKFYFNLSHSLNWIVWAFSISGKVGVDLEYIRNNVMYEKIAERYFHRCEIQKMNQSNDPKRLFFDLWAAKESLVKASGKGVFAGMKDIKIPIDHDGLPLNMRVGDFYLKKIEAGSRYACSLASEVPISKQPCYDFGGLQWQS